jgi:sulfate-transporting ATPase
MASYQYIFTMKDLRKVHPGGKEVLRGIYLSFFPGAKIGVLGVNGSGKSRLLRIMAGVDKEFIGEARPADGHPHRLPAARAPARPVQGP